MLRHVGALRSRWINTVLGNFKTSPSGSFHEYAARYVAAFTYRFKRRLDPRTLLQQRLLVAAVRCGAHPERTIRMAKVRC